MRQSVHRTTPSFNTGAVSRRSFLRTASAAGAALAGCAPGAQPQITRHADVSLRISPHNLELAPNIIVPTTAYNDRVPGPVIRLPARRIATIDVTNATAITDLAHWHGLYSPSEADGAIEEGTPPVHTGQTVRYMFEPRPAGAHWYHTHSVGGADFSVGAYTGQHGFFIIDDGSDAGAYDQEVLVAMHHWSPRWVSGQRIRPEQPDHGLEVEYEYGAMNGRIFGHNDPIRVREGQRVLFRLLNACATENTWTTLSGHSMRVIAMDGVPVPTPHNIEVLLLGPGERADVIVEMNRPGVWVLGSAQDDQRAKGMAMVVEYANASGSPVWQPPRARTWDYLSFARAGAAATEPDEIIPLFIDKIAGGANGHNTWTFNGKAWPDTDIIRVREGRRYRLRVINRTDHGHPFHLHRHHFEVVNYGGHACAGLMKDTINIRPNSTVELDFAADNPGPTLIHCHQAKHMEFGLMAMMVYDGDLDRMGMDQDRFDAMLRGSACRPGQFVALRQQ